MNVTLVFERRHVVRDNEGTVVHAFAPGDTVQARQAAHGWIVTDGHARDAYIYFNQAKETDR